MSSRSKTNAYSASNIDVSAAQELADISEIGVYGDLSPLILFIQKNNLIRSLTNISYFSSVNDVGLVAKNAKNLANVLGYINYVVHDTNPESRHLAVKLSLLEERDRIIEFYSELCSNHLKTVYKFYGMRKPLSVVYLTQILLALVEYKNHQVLSTFQESFDFNHSTLLKILVPTRDEFEKKIIGEFSMRGAVMELWIALCSQSNSAFRKSLLTNFKIMNNFWKHVEMDRYETLSKIVVFLDKFVLSETSFKRSTKCQILNENFLYNMRNLFSLVKDKNDRAGDDDEIEFSSFKSDFLDFMAVLVSDQAKGITYPQNEFGSPLEVNNRTFKINNKLIYTLLTALKSWDSYPQLQYCLKILNSNLELVAPYMNWIVAFSGGYHDPSLTSYWIGHTLLYTEILKSLSLPCVPDTISLAPLSKNALTECLSFPSDLVKQLSLQLVLLQLLKLGDSPLQLVAESVLGNLPAQASFLPLLTHENKLIKLTTTMIIRRWETVVPGSSSSAVVSVVSLNLASLNLDDGACDTFELVLLENYLSIQSNNDLRWWNKTAKGNSFFTSLLKLSSIGFLEKKVFHILEKLTRTSFIFAGENLVESPLLILVESISRFAGSSLESLWNCLDETIARSMKSPYKYLDKSHTEYNDLHVFVVALFEQLDFAAGIRDQAGVMDWLKEYLTKLAIVGESRESLLKLAQEYKFDIQIDLDKLSVPKNIISKVDLATAISVLNRTANSRKEDWVFELMSNIGGYLLGSDLEDKSLFGYITNPGNFAFFSSLTSEPISTNESLAVTLYSDILSQLKGDYVNSKLSAFVLALCKQKIPKKSQFLLSKYLWLLSDEQLSELVSVFENEHLVISAYKEVCSRNLKIQPDFGRLLKLKSSEIQPILKHFQNEISDVNMIMANLSLYFLLDEPNLQISQQLLDSEALPEDVLYRVAGANRAIAEKFKELVIDLALSMENWSQSLKIFSEYCDWFDSEAILRLAFDQVDGKPKLAMTAEFAEFVALYVATTGTHANDKIKLWLQRAMIYINKKFAESLELSSNFDNFLAATVEFTAKFESFRLLIPVNVLNTQFEVLLAHSKWVTSEKYLAYANKTLLVFKGFNAEKLLQIFVTNENNVLRKLPGADDASVRFESGLLIHVLYNSGTHTASLALTTQILDLYLGSARAEDQLIKDVLVSNEAKTNKSWVYNVTNWEFTDELSQKEIDLVGQDRLILKDKTSIVVALNRSFVTNTVRHMCPVPAIPKRKNYSDYVRFSKKCFSGPYRATVYDAEFLFLVLLNNEELVREDEGKIQFSLAKIIESGLLHFIVASLALDHVRDIAKVILHGILKYIDTTETVFKDKNIIKVYVASILHTLRVADHQTPMVWYFIGEFANILGNPGHFLYERVTRYILSTPVFRPFEIPLYKTIIMSLTNEDAIDEDNYYKQVSWLLDLLTVGLTSSSDLKMLQYREVIEWALNVSNLAYAPGLLKTKILRFINEVQSLNTEGNDLLVTKFAGFSSLELLKRSLKDESLSCVQQALNIDQIALKTGLVSQTQKRVRDWTDGDVVQSVKRIHSRGM